MSRIGIFRVLNGVVAAAFLISAVLQYNDPDPWRWVAMYFAAGLACLVYRRMPVPFLVPALVGASALLWAAALAPETLPNLRVGELAEEMHASTPEIELGREMLGLLVIAAWMFVLVASARARPATD